jgi:hypothetical protein
VYYDVSNQRAKANVVLEDLVKAYGDLVETWGFPAPSLAPGETHYRVYLQSLSGYALGVTYPYAENTSTPRSDAYSYMAVDPATSDALLPATIAHEFVHATQMEVDVREVVTFMENSAVYLQNQVFAEPLADLVATFWTFQSQPYRPLEYNSIPNSDGYEYGGSLFVYWLQDTLGGREPAWLRVVWDDCPQTGYVNEPDYLDILGGRFASQGGLIELVRRFGRDRFFVGTDDDGQHMANVGNWRGAEVWRTRTWHVADLPVRDQVPEDPATRPQPNGCNYVVLESPEPADFPVTFSFSGEADVLWSVDVLRVAQGQPTTFTPVILSAYNSGSAVVESAGTSRVVMVVCLIAPDDYDPDDRSWGSARYRYSITMEEPTPWLAGVDPAAVDRGAVDAPVTLSGGGLSWRAQVLVSGEGVTARVTEAVSSGELRLAVSVAADAEVGPRDVTVLNPGGAQATASGVLTVNAGPGDPGSAGDSDGSGEEDGPACRCADGARGGWPWLAWAAVAWGVGRRRR